VVKIRLRRVGPKKQPSYRIVVADSHSPRDGRFIENIGHYNPRTEPITVEIKEERARYWLGVGAQPTEAVARLLHKKGILESFDYSHRQGSKVESASEGAEAEIPLEETSEQTTEGEEAKVPDERPPEEASGQAPEEASGQAPEETSGQAPEETSGQAPEEEPSE